MGRAERSTSGKLDVVVVVMAVVDGVARVPVADVAASVVAGLQALMQDARRIATTTAPRRIPRDYIPTLKAPFETILAEVAAWAPDIDLNHGIWDPDPLGPGPLNINQAEAMPTIAAGGSLRPGARRGSHNAFGSSTKPKGTPDEAEVGCGVRGGSPLPVMGLPTNSLVAGEVPIP